LDGSVFTYAGFFGAISDQALNPMPNSAEHNSDRLAVCEHVAASKYAELYELVWGVEIDCSDDLVVVKAADVEEERAYDISFKRLMLAVGAYQGSEDINSFSSKRDYALQAELACACQDEDGEAYPGEEVCSVVMPNYEPSVCTEADYLNSPGDFPLAGLNDVENLGHDLFYGITSDLNPEGKNANCGACHSDTPPALGPGGTPGDTGAELFQLYADDGFHNIGTPANPEIPDTGVNPDEGLIGLTGNPRHLGLFKTPTLRNVDKRKGDGFVKAYAHNGWFKSLESIVHFYNTAFLGGPIFPFPGAPVIPYEETTAYLYGITRCPENIVTEKDALANNCWPEAAGGINSFAIPALLGDLKLTPEEEAAVVEYMKTLTDAHTAKAPHPYK
jgi:cytochrome c peroxidase